MTLDRPPIPDGAETPAVPSRFGSLRLGEPARFVGVFLLVVALTLSTVAALNYLVDPRAEFGTGMVRPLTMDEAYPRTQAIESGEIRPDTLVFGNSRMFTIDGDMLAGTGPGETLNFAISQSTIHDQRVVYRYVSDRSETLDQLVLGLDVRLLRSQTTLKGSVLSNPHLAPYTGSGPGDPLAERLVDTVSKSYVQDTARTLGYAATSYPQTDTFLGSNETVHKRFIHKQLREGTFDSQARVDERIDRQVERTTRMNSPAPEAADALEAIVEQARANDVTVRLVLPPMHPDLAQRLASTDYPEQLDKVRELALSLCQPGVHVYDLTDPTTLERYGGTVDEFRDPLHTFGDLSSAIGEAAADPALDGCGSSQTDRFPAS